MPPPDSPTEQMPAPPAAASSPTGPSQRVSQVRPRSDHDRDMLEPDEYVVVVVHRHPIGIIAIYLVALIAIIAVLVIGLYVAPSVIKDFSPTTRRLIVAGGIFAFAILLIVLFVATYVYRQSKLIVTDKSLIQVLQKGLFIRKVSRLSMSNVEDVNAEQRGIIASLFNYGTLMIQTAGTMENFVFPYCPDPNLYADEIIEARQQFVRHRREQITYDELQHLANRDQPAD